MKAEIIENLPFDEYLAIEAMNSSSVKALYQSPLHYINRNNRKETGSLARGTLAHSAVLEPDIFKRCVVTPEKRINEKGQSVKFVRSGSHWAEFQEEHAGKIIISNDEFKTAGNIATMIRGNQDARLALAGRHELTIVWDDPLWGKCKARIDAQNDYTADLKTSQRIDPHGFGMAAMRYGYDIQAEWYLRAVRAAELYSKGFRFVAVENAMPHDSAVYDASENMLAKGREKIAAAHKNFLEVKLGNTSGKFHGIQELDPYYYEDDEIEYTD